MNDLPEHEPTSPPRWGTIPPDAPLDAATLEAARTKKILAGVLAIVLGCLGAHKFALGFLGTGFVMLGVSIVGSVASSCLCLPGVPAYVMALIGLIEGIIYLSKPDDQFYRAYIARRRTWF